MDIKNFTINDLERFSGIKANTLRVWERRYALLTPVRTASNFRVYTLDELKKVLDIALLTKNGHRISGLSKNHSSALEDKIGLLSNDHNKWQKAINDLTINMYTVEPESFEWVLDELLLVWPIEIVIEKIIYPFLHLTRLLWVGNKLCHEHLVVTAIRKKLILAIETAPPISTGKKSVLLFLSDTRQLDLGLLYSNYFLKRRGIHVLYLGNDVTIHNLKSIFHDTSPTYLFTYLQRNDHLSIAKLLECMKLYAPAAKLIIARYFLENPPLGISDNLLEMDHAQALFYLAENCK